ncbi:MAG: hypothetical protein CMI09_08180 [Oceanospirillaceae bacterium]|nr:hypothetical protein [Oceanospirillaceae bacterium]
MSQRFIDFLRAIPVNATISSIGLNSYEEGLIQGHLKILNTKTRDFWSYVGAGDDADLVITRKPVSTSGEAKVAILAEDGFRKAKNNLYYLGESLRIFSLLELLLDIEHDTSEDPLFSSSSITTCAASSIHDFCAALPTSERFEILVNNQPCCQVLFDQGEWKAASHQTKTDVISQLSNGHIRFNEQPSDIGLAATLTVKELLWELGAKHSTNRLSQTHQYRISSWPLFGTWYSAPYMARLSALYSKRFASIDDGVRFSGASPAQVQAFLSACHLCDLGLQKRPVLEPSDKDQLARPEPQTLTKGLLHGLRKKLGMAFSHD